MKHNEETNRLLTERFGKDSLIALATVEDGIPHVRTVDAYYCTNISWQFWRSFAESKK